MRTRRIIECVGSLTALLIGSWGIYLDIASNGKEPLVMRWFAAALGIAAATWIAARLAGR
jgi:hypothetical protein